MAGPRYSLYRYGLPQADADLNRSLSCVATMRLVSLARQDILRAVAFSERLRLGVNLSSGMRRAALLSGDLTVSAGGRSQFKREIRAATTVGLGARAGTERTGALAARAAFHLRADMSADRGAALKAGEALGLGARLTACLYRACVLGETVEVGAAACADITASSRLKAVLTLRGAACMDMGGAVAGRSPLALLAALGKLDGRVLWMEGGARLLAGAVKDWPSGLTASAGLYVRAASGYLERETITVRCVIPPGGALTIDTEHYTVTLDGANVLHLQEGGWPKLSRDLLSLALSSGTGGALEGRVTYREAYL